jgi:hypothetical protein
VASPAFVGALTPPGKPRRVWGLCVKLERLPRRLIRVYFNECGECLLRRYAELLAPKVKLK